MILIIILNCIQIAMLVIRTVKVECVFSPTLIPFNQYTVETDQA